MNVRILKVFGHDMNPVELRKAAEAAAKALNGRRFKLPVVDSVFGQGYEILFIDDDFSELIADNI